MLPLPYAHMVEVAGEPSLSPKEGGASAILFFFRNTQSLSGPSKVI
jgi:hypothetical protein